jgi:cellulose synthase operon protein C
LHWRSCKTVPWFRQQERLMRRHAERSQPLPRSVQRGLRPIAWATVLLLGGSGLLGGCSGLWKGRASTLPEPTLASLEGRSVAIDKSQVPTTSAEQAKSAYREFLAALPAQSPAARHAPQRAEALRRLGDLELEQADLALADSTDPAKDAALKADLKSAIGRYQQLLKDHPQQPGNDRVLYQLARAQELAGEPQAALATLDRLTQQHPDSKAIDEVQFRRGEVLFNTQRYPAAEAAYAAALKADPDGLYGERAEYMLGWSRFKQGRVEEGLDAFFSVLDRRADALANPEAEAALPRADRELLEDTFRVTSLSLASQNGAESIAPRINSDTRRRYEYRVHEGLADLYLKQERVKDAADTYSAFTRRHPFHAESPRMQAQVIGIYEDKGFAALALEAKRDHVTRYGVKSEFRTVNPEGWAKAQPLVKQHLGELARHHHSLAQKNRSRADVQEAIRWYGEIITAYPKDPEAPANHFLLAELLFEDQRFAEAAEAYGKTAYGYPTHAKSAEAGYAALLALDKQGDAARPQRIDSALQFAKTFADDSRAGPVLATTAEALGQANDWRRASDVAEQVLALKPAAAAEQQRVAHTVLGHAAFERGDAAAAEKAYAQALALAGPAQASATPIQKALSDRLAAAIYKQGEAARAKGQSADALVHFNRVAAAAPGSSVQATAEFDAAVTHIALKNWPAASQALEAFRQRHPNHPLQAEVAPKLAVAYLEQKRPADAANEFERVAESSRDAELARAALWQAAELHEQAGARAKAANAYGRYAQRHATPLEPNLEARWRQARFAREDGQVSREQALMREIADGDARGGSARTERTRTLGGLATLALTEPQWQAYQQVRLVEPLQRNLAQKKARMQELLQAYTRASDGAGAAVTTAATYRSAALYQDFGKALMGSERPRRLAKKELEQYNLMLEEQAFPFEEQAIQFHEANARRASQGLYDEWVRRSFDALATLKPVRWGKGERGGVAVNSANAGRSDITPEAITRLEKATEAPGARGREWNQLGVAYRQAGRFADARKAYDRAIELDAQFAPAVLNLGILNDLYLAEPQKALPLYERYASLVPAESQQVNRWIAELRNRKPGGDQVARTP